MAEETPPAPAEAPANPPPPPAPAPSQPMTAPVVTAPPAPPEGPNGEAATAEAPPSQEPPKEMVPAEPPKKKGWWGRMKDRVKESMSPKGAMAKMLQGVAQKAADDFVDKKVGEIRATADEFTKEKVNEIKAEAHMLISYIETKIDQKINEIEKKLDERIAKEMEWRLKSMVLTLVFVFLMTLVSLGYFAVKRWMTG